MPCTEAEKNGDLPLEIRYNVERLKCGTLCCFLAWVTSTRSTPLCFGRGQKLYTVLSKRRPSVYLCHTPGLCLLLRDIVTPIECGAVGEGKLLGRISCLAKSSQSLLFCSPPGPRASPVTCTLFTLLCRTGWWALGY